MKMSRVMLLITLLLVAGLGALFYFYVEIVPSTTRGSQSEEASRNHYLAAGQLLERRGHTVRFLPSYTATPTGPGLLFLNQPDSSLQADQAERLLAWVRAGNELLLRAPDQTLLDKKIEDPLLSPLGAYRQQQHWSLPNAKEKAAPADNSADNMDEALAEQDAPRPSDWLRLDSGEGLQTTFTPFFSLHDSRHRAETALADHSGVHVLRFAVGRGHITVLSDTRLFTNDDIGDSDNAALWLYLTDRPKPSTIWIVFSGRYPSLSSLAWQYGWAALLSLATLITAWLWRSSSRFGPLLPSVDAPRRQLSEHLRACGRYLWYAGQQLRLYNAMRASLRRRMLLRHPHWRQLSNNDLVGALAEFSGLEPGALRRALIEKPGNDLAQFLSDMRVMNHIRKML